MTLYEYARKLNKVFKEKKKAEAGRYLSPVRRLERFAPVPGERVVAMTFDDGPMNLPPEPVNEKYTSGTSLTELLLEIMKAYGATGTFDVIGSTKENYPDKAGAVHSTRWGGVRHDHYPCFGKDDFAGAASQPALIEKLLENGHELANHGFRHVLFGPNRMIYGSRSHFSELGEVTGDLQRLHTLIETEHRFTMRFSRPPHYIDRIPDGYTSYDAYALLGYDYMAASFDGGGWLGTTGDYKADVDKMVAPLEKALKADPNALNGQIIFQKDGYNQSLMTPVAHALEAHLRLLGDNGYRIVPVGALKKLSPFEDVGAGADYIEKLRELDGKGRVIGYKNNTFKPDQALTHGEMLTMTLTKADYSDFMRREVVGKARNKPYRAHPYYVAYEKYGMTDQLGRSDELVSTDDVKRFLYDRLGVTLGVESKGAVPRREFICYL